MPTKSQPSPPASARGPRKIDRHASVLFGPVKSTADAESLSMFDSGNFLQSSENGNTYPREYSGRQFIKSFNVRTYEDYLVNNPENLKAGRRYAFYEKDALGNYSLAWTGTMSVPPSGLPPATTNGTLADDYNGSRSPNGQTIVVQTPQPQQQPQAGPSRTQLDDIMESMREDKERLHAEITRLQVLNTDLQSKLIEAERGRIQAESERASAQQRAESDIAALRAEHEREIERMKHYHTESINILAEKAAAEAQKVAREQYEADRVATLDDDRDRPTLSDKLMPLIETFTPVLSDVASAFIDRLLAGRSQQPQPQPQPQQVMMPPPSMAVPQPQPQPQPVPMPEPWNNGALLPGERP